MNSCSQPRVQMPYNNLVQRSAILLLASQQFQTLLTFFSKSFSHFPQGICLLSIPSVYLALHEFYHLLGTPLPRSTTLGNTPYMTTCKWNTGFSPSVLLYPKSLTLALALDMQLQSTTQSHELWFTPWTPPDSFASPLQFLTLCLLICLNSASEFTQHHAHNKHYT